MNISSKVLLHTVAEGSNEELITFEMQFPRYILAEINTHREFNKNSASSRAIPFSKMVESVMTNPFIPLAFQKNHSGMQGSQYFGYEEVFGIQKEVELMEGVTIKMPEKLAGLKMGLEEWWLELRNVAVAHAIAFHNLSEDKVTKQLCNRLLEPFMLHKIILTTSISGLQNFFFLRCPRFSHGQRIDEKTKYYKSWNSLIEDSRNRNPNYDDSVIESMKSYNFIQKQAVNSGQADIHLMELASSIFDEYTKSKPQLLRTGEWHIPYEDKIDEILSESAIVFDSEESRTKFKIKVSTAMIARVSYTTVGEEKSIDLEKLVKLHDVLLESKHMSPFEHIGRVMTNDEYHSYIRGRIVRDNSTIHEIDDRYLGWCRNLKGYVQYRSILEDF